MNDVDALLWASREIGKNTDYVVWGGGNSSVKSTAYNFRGRKVQAIYVKGSGSDMKTLSRKNLAMLDLEAILELRARASMSDEAMVEYLSDCQIAPGPRGSIETLLHAFLPGKFILHTHADATAALTDNPHSKKHVEACWKGTVALVPYQRPGFVLSKAVLQVSRRGRPVAGPPLKGVMLDKHGLITWGETAEEALRQTKQLISQAGKYVAARGPKESRANVVAKAKAGFLREDGRVGHPPLRVLLAALRGALSQSERQILHVDRSPEAVKFSLRKDAAKLCQGGPATPDHLLYTKPRALFISNPERVQREVAAYRKWYDAYFKKFATPNLKKLDSSPRVIVVQGFGVITAGKDPRQALTGRDIFRHSMRVRQAAQGLGGYAPIGLNHIFDFEYWPLENYKLTLAPPEKEMSRKIVVVTGAARGIGKACALRLAQEGASVAFLDLDLKAASLASTQLGDRGMAIRCDISDEKAVKRAFDQVVETWGGLDLLVSNAGLAKCSPVDSMPLKDWEQSFAVNSRGHFLCCREAARIFKAQGIGGSVVVVSSKNVLAPGKDFGAYSASKAAQTQLSKVLALELAPYQVRVNCVTPDGVFEDSRLWDGIRESRAKAHGIASSALEDFYAGRNLLKRKVTPADVAEAVLYLTSERSSKTTGALLPVDGGVKEAFPR